MLTKKDIIKILETKKYLDLPDPKERLIFFYVPNNKVHNLSPSVTETHPMLIASRECRGVSQKSRVLPKGNPQVILDELLCKRFSWKPQDPKENFALRASQSQQLISCGNLETSRHSCSKLDWSVRESLPGRPESEPKEHQQLETPTAKVVSSSTQHSIPICYYDLTFEEDKKVHTSSIKEIANAYPRESLDESIQPTAHSSCKDSTEAHKQKVSLVSMAPQFAILERIQNSRKQLFKFPRTVQAENQRESISKQASKDRQRNDSQAYKPKLLRAQSTAQAVIKEPKSFAVSIDTPVEYVDTADTLAVNREVVQGQREEGEDCIHLKSCIQSPTRSDNQVNGSAKLQKLKRIILGSASKMVDMDFYPHACMTDILLNKAERNESLEKVVQQPFKVLSLSRSVSIAEVNQGSGRTKLPCAGSMQSLGLPRSDNRIKFAVHRLKQVSLSGPTPAKEAAAWKKFDYEKRVLKEAIIRRKETTSYRSESRRKIDCPTVNLAQRPPRLSIVSSSMILERHHIPSSMASPKECKEASLPKQATLFRNDHEAGSLKSRGRGRGGSGAADRRLVHQRSQQNSAERPPV